ncbi:hypothetical protein FRC09_004573 [Ceratobasidium sp. 395]|nr:hypothetical protein FRC09_004573 [Ceratobasidium sp. 395]
MVLRLRKPVIYLFPPVPTSNIRVELSLANTWEFSAIYPPTPVLPESHQGVSGCQSITWNVDAKPDGTLLDHRTSRMSSYLFWEAHAKLASPLSPVSSRPTSPTRNVSGAFDPSRPTLTPMNSVLLPFEKVAGYVDDALMALGLHTEARCFFITYWLPYLQVHEHIALRFLPQTDYEAAAPMNISPVPDVTTRVFMLFRGVKESEIDLWEQVKAAQNPGIWQDVVAVDTDLIQNSKLFRVLEWGGMEIK